MTRIQANLLLLLAGALWGGGFVAQSTAMQSIGPILFIGLRFVAATLVTVPFAWREARAAQAPLASGSILAFLSIGGLLFFGMLAQQYGLLTTTVTNSGFLTGLYVVFTPFLAVALFRDWPHPIVWPCAAVAFAGIWLLSGGTLSTLTIGDWLTILCAVIWAFQLTMIARHAAKTGRPVTLAAIQFAVSAALGLGLGLIVEPFDIGAIRQALPEILYAGVIAGGLAFTLQAVAQRYTTAAQAAIMLSSESVFAGLFGAILAGDRLSAAGLAGCAVIFAAIVAVEVVPALARKPEPATP